MHTQPEPTIAELCFDDFRKQFPHWRVWVEGDKMSFRYSHKTMLESAKSYAEYLIEKYKYPLEVSVDIDKLESLPMLLILTYKKNEPNTPNTSD